MGGVNWVRHMCMFQMFKVQRRRLIRHTLADVGCVASPRPLCRSRRAVPSVAVLAQDAINATDAEATGHLGVLSA